MSAIWPIWARYERRACHAHEHSHHAITALLVTTVCSTYSNTSIYYTVHGGAGETENTRYREVRISRYVLKQTLYLGKRFWGTRYYTGWAKKIARLRYVGFESVMFRCTVVKSKNLSTHSWKFKKIEKILDSGAPARIFPIFLNFQLYIERFFVRSMRRYIRRAIFSAHPV